ncbi:DNA polymerase delta subunit 3-like isoform X2 [Aethina tumida]|uniref:DNA polymerase delta subunit 3-like isoform X2 n=1 Tax=Aethina tumida TaxID=116153 RepID=UPI00096B3170|nr:DNA polymerase delta subunit 3-like isoform X2 [Aethina tumida]
MDSATEDLYMQQLQELVRDEDKIITLPIVASKFNLNVQAARDLLQKFSKDNKDLIATYMITGITKENKKRAVIMLKNEDTQKKDDIFESISGQTIFSIQKSDNVDFNTIFMANKEELANRESSLQGYIVSKNSVKRVLKTKKLPPPPVPTIKGRSTVFFKQQKPEEKKEETPSAFNKKEQNAEQKSPASKKPDNKGKPGALANMFSKMPIKPKKEQDTNQKDDKENVNDLNMEVDVNEDEDKSTVSETTKIVKEQPKTDSKKTSKRPRTEKSNDAPNKKRKRIIQKNDSDSDDLFENEEEENENIIEKSDDEPEPVKVKPTFVPKNKRRKAVEKTYEDDEGFIVTKTEYVFESASDEEEPPKKPPEPKANPQKKVDKKNSSNSETEVSPKSNSKGKKGKKETKSQPSIMSFFKKK